MMEPQIEYVRLEALRLAHSDAEREGLSNDERMRRAMLYVEFLTKGVVREAPEPQRSDAQPDLFEAVAAARKAIAESGEVRFSFAGMASGKPIAIAGRPISLAAQAAYNALADLHAEMDKELSRQTDDRLARGLAARNVVGY